MQLHRGAETITIAIAMHRATETVTRRSISVGVVFSA
jgi:hypothetical protein